MSDKPRRTVDFANVRRADALALDGVLFHRSTSVVQEGSSYSHGLPWHALYATLAGGTRRSRGRVEDGPWIERPDRAGAVSFTPARRWRDGIIEDGGVVCAHIEFDPAFVAAACQVPEPALRWTTCFNAGDARLFAMARFVAEMAAAHHTPRASIEAVMVAFARTLGRRLGGIEPRSDDAWLNPGALRRVVDRIEADPAADLSLVTLAAETGLGTSAFIRAFRGSVGATPGQYVVRRRLARARELLQSSRAPVEDVARRTGFGSAAHLTAAFRQRLGTTPGRLRRG